MEASAGQQNGNQPVEGAEKAVGEEYELQTATVRATPTPEDPVVERENGDIAQSQQRENEEETSKQTLVQDNETLRRVPVMKRTCGCSVQTALLATVLSIQVCTIIVVWMVWVLATDKVLADTMQEFLSAAANDVAGLVVLTTMDACAITQSLCYRTWLVGPDAVMNYTDLLPLIVGTTLYQTEYTNVYVLYNDSLAMNVTILASSNAWPDITQSYIIDVAENPPMRCIEINGTAMGEASPVITGSALPQDRCRPIFEKNLPLMERVSGLYSNQSKFFTFDGELTIATPLRNKGAAYPRGVFGVSLDVARVSAVLATYMNRWNGYAAVLNKESCNRTSNNTFVYVLGNAVLATFGPNATNSPMYTVQQDVCNLLLSGQNISDLPYKSSSGLAIYVKEMTPGEGTCTLGGIDPWILVVAVNTRTAAAQVINNRTATGGLVGILCGIAMAIAVVLAHSISRPIKAMNKFMKSLAAPTGDEDDTGWDDDSGMEDEVFVKDLEEWTVTGADAKSLLTQWQRKVDRMNNEAAVLKRNIATLQAQLSGTPTSMPVMKPVTVKVCTWNVGNALPPTQLRSWLGGDHDIVAVGVQECVYSGNSEEHFFGVVQSSLGADYVLVESVNIVSGSLSQHKTLASRQQPTADQAQTQPASDQVSDSGTPGPTRHHALIDPNSQPQRSGALANGLPRDGDGAVVKKGVDLKDPTGNGGLRLAVYVRREHVQYISDIKKSRETTGIAGAFWNKGGVGLSFRMYRSTLCFVSAHLAAHQEKVGNRNKDYATIAKGLNLGHKHRPLTHQFDYLFWCGDLNYRIDHVSYEECVRLINLEDWPTLHEIDQLNVERAAGRVFAGFEEAPLEFAPTFKMNRNRGTYDEQRIPSWCDRILWKTPPGQPLSVLQYGSCREIRTSDHRPVYGTYLIGLHLRHVPLTTHPPLIIRLSEIVITPLPEAPAMSKPTLHAGPYKPADPFAECVSWPTPTYRGQMLVYAFKDLSVIIPDPEYLKVQHLALGLQDGDSRMCVAIVSMQPVVDEVGTGIAITTHMARSNGNTHTISLAIALIAP